MEANFVYLVKLYGLPNKQCHISIANCYNFIVLFFSNLRKRKILIIAYFIFFAGFFVLFDENSMILKNVYGYSTHG